MNNTYTVALTKSGQMTLPKALREFLGVEGAKRVTIRQEKDRVTIQRFPTEAEFRARMDAGITPEVRRHIEANRGKSTREMIDEYLNSPAGQKEMEEKYGPRLTRR